MSLREHCGSLSLLPGARQRLSAALRLRFSARRDPRPRDGAVRQRPRSTRRSSRGARNVQAGQGRAGLQGPLRAR